MRDLGDRAKINALRAEVEKIWLARTFDARAWAHVQAELTLALLALRGRKHRGGNWGKADREQHEVERAYVRSVLGAARP